MVYVLGDPIPASIDGAENGTLEFYVTGTSTPATVYSDSAGTSLGTTVNLNASGRPETSGGTEV
jgi:hypothetical protein